MNCSECGQKFLQWDQTQEKFKQMHKIDNAMISFYCLNGHETCFHFRNNKLNSQSVGGFNVR